jgi:hypothetical protein
LSETVLLVDAGDFGSPKEFKPWLRTEFQWKMMEKLAYDAVTPGPNEMILGTAKLLDLFATVPGIRVVSANVTDQGDNLLWEESAVFEKGGVTYAVTGVTDEAYYKYNVARDKQKVDDFGFRDVRESLNRVLPDLQEKADVVVALLHMSAADAKRLIKDVEGIDVAVVGHNPGYTFTPERAGQTLLVRGGTRGQYVSVLKLTLNTEGRILDYNGEGRPLGEGVRDDDTFKAVVTEFDKSYDALQERGTSLPATGTTRQYPKPGATMIRKLRPLTHRALLLLGMLPALGALSTPAPASSIVHHHALCETALGEMGWPDPDILTVARSNVATDIGRLPEHSRAAIRILLPKTGREVPMVRALAATAPWSPNGSSGFHFNSLYSFTDIASRWRELESWVDDTVELLRGERGEERRGEYLSFVGMVTHMVQDFYSHANWIGLLNEFTPGEMNPEEFPLWEELVDNEDGWRERNPAFPWRAALHRLRLSNAVVREADHLGGLQTGSVRWEEFIGMRPWGHRHKGGREREVVHALAIRATHLWVRRIEEKLNAPPAVASPVLVQAGPLPPPPAGVANRSVDLSTR